MTIDLFFDEPKNFERFAESQALDGELFASLYGADPAQVRRVLVRSLNMVKISYPRPEPQGWRGERDMHQGQSYARLLDIELQDADPPSQ